MYQLKRSATKLERKGSAYGSSFTYYLTRNQTVKLTAKVMLDFQNHFELILSSEVGFGVWSVFAVRMPVSAYKADR